MGNHYSRIEKVHKNAGNLKITSSAETSGDLVDWCFK
jgi:hypothetical protein